MTLVNTRAAFEKAVTDAVAAVDATVEMVYDNMVYKTPGKTKEYIGDEFIPDVTRSVGTSLALGAIQGEPEHAGLSVQGRLHPYQIASASQRMQTLAGGNPNPLLGCLTLRGPVKTGVF